MGHGAGEAMKSTCLFAGKVWEFPGLAVAAAGALDEEQREERE